MHWYILFAAFVAFSFFVISNGDSQGSFKVISGPTTSVQASIAQPLIPDVIPKLKTPGHMNVIISETQTFRNSGQIGGIAITHDIVIDGITTQKPLVWLSDDMAIEEAYRLLIAYITRNP